MNWTRPSRLPVRFAARGRHDLPSLRQSAALLPGENSWSYVIHTAARRYWTDGAVER